MKSFCLAAGFALSPAFLFAGEKELEGLPLLFSEDFENGADRWEPTDKNAWRVDDGHGGKVYHQHKKRSKYSPFYLAMGREKITAIEARATAIGCQLTH